MKAITERISATTIGSSLGQELKVVQETQAQMQEAEDAKAAKVLLNQDDEWEEVEIGKGLSHYNAVEIDRIKGMKRYVFVDSSTTSADDI
jgi:hypothetical protein